MLTASTIVVLTVTQLCYSQDLPTVSTPLGTAEGHFLVSGGGNKYKAFEGIPYALPPTEERRFKAPEPIESWSGRLLANEFKEKCIGLRIGGGVSGVEDCLYLNVYAPKNESSKVLPVIFWIYGGAFQFSALRGDEQRYLIDRDVIFVSFNYRHGALGFLSTEDDVVSGNMGLKDQALALRWVSENIKYFGGDPKQVMIAGLSAGGASVHYHYLSPMTAGLFHSGISFSGTAFDCWAQTENSRQNAITLGELMGCPTNDIDAMIRCLKNIQAHILVKAQAHLMSWRFNLFTPFGPVVEKSTDKPFIDRSPIDIINSGHAHNIPWITGVVSEEGLCPVAEFATNETAIQELNENWESIAPHLLHYYYTILKEQHTSVARKIRKHYFGDEPINKENLFTLTHLVGDRLFIYDAEKAAREQAKSNRGPVWFYYYSYRAANSRSDPMTNTTENFGVSHADDVSLILGNPFITPTKTEKDLTMHNDLVKFWLSVARKGEPKFGPEWLKVDPQEANLDYLHMAGPGNFKLVSNSNLAEKNFWGTIEFNENKISGKNL